MMCSDTQSAGYNAQHSSVRTKPKCYRSNCLQIAALCCIIMQIAEELGHLQSKTEHRCTVYVAMHLESKHRDGRRGGDGEHSDEAQHRRRLRRPHPFTMSRPHQRSILQPTHTQRERDRQAFKYSS